MRKLAELQTEPTQESLMIEINGMIRDARETIVSGERQLAELQAKLVSGLSEQAKASLSVMGQSVKKNLNRAREYDLELQKRRNELARSQARAEIAKSDRHGDAVRELRKLRTHSEAVLSGQVSLDAANRRRLAHALVVAEDDVRATA